MPGASPVDVVLPFRAAVDRKTADPWDSFIGARLALHSAKCFGVRRECSASLTSARFRASSLPYR